MSLRNDYEYATSVSGSSAYLNVLLGCSAGETEEYQTKKFKMSWNCVGIRNRQWTSNWNRI